MSLPADLAAAHAMILAERGARRQAEAMVSAATLEIERLRLLLARARREQFGHPRRSPDGYAGWGRDLAIPKNWSIRG